jgi:uncharacterized protein (TIGR04222 family)
VIGAARTWGLTNAEFNVLYSGLCVMYAMVAVRRRRALKGDRFAATADAELPAISAAMLIAGAYGAVLGATAALLSRGLLVAGADGAPVVNGDADADEVERAVIEVVRAAPGIGVHAMYRRLRNEPALDRLTSRLVSDGVLTRPGEIRRMRRLLPVGILLALLGVARIVGVELHVDDLKPPADNLGVVPFLLMCAVFMYALLLVFEWPGATAAGEDILAQLYERYPEPAVGPVADANLPYVVALHGPAAIAVNYPSLSSWLDDEITWHTQRR